MSIMVSVALLHSCHCNMNTVLDDAFKKRKKCMVISKSTGFTNTGSGLNLAPELEFADSFIRESNRV